MLRRVITIILIVCLMLTWIPPASADDSAYAFVRVKLSMGKPTSITVLLDGNYSVLGDDSIVLKRDSYTVKLSSGKIKLYYGSDSIYSGSSLTFIQRAATPDTNNRMRLNNTKYGYTYYLGDMQFIPYSSASYIAVINKVYIEDYLYGVLPYEMSDSWPIEALKTQAVCARNYVENHMGGSVYDVVDTSSSQVYRGYNASNKNSIKAVDATAGTVVTSGGKLAEVFFAASNGGYTDIPQHVWSATAALKPYHIIQEDAYDAANTYSPQEVLIFPKAVTDDDKIKYQYASGGKMVTGSGSESANVQNYLLTSALQAVKDKGYAAETVSDIKIVGVNSIAPLDYEGQHGIKDYNGNNACVCYEQAAVNMTVLAKRFVPDTGGVKLGDVNNDGVINISDYTLIRLNILGLKTLSEAEKAPADVDKDGKINIGDYTLLRLSILGLKGISGSSSGSYVEEPVTVNFNIDLHELDKSGGKYQAFDNMSLRLFVVKETDKSWNIYQRRYGHGVGMSQRGTEQRAKSSDSDINTYDKILGFYYPNTDLTVQKYTRPELTPLSQGS